MEGSGVAATVTRFFSPGLRENVEGEITAEVKNVYEVVVPSFRCDGFAVAERAALMVRRLTSFPLACL